ncbi:peptidoglycan DD-metalloendopeptidase family protein [Patescibacteria group bacterium]|nr:peptidoglycan DD-metalloendopeptidase family protein [Patescibacteria group bacterium]
MSDNEQDDPIKKFLTMLPCMICCGCCLFIILLGFILFGAGISLKTIDLKKSVWEIAKQTGQGIFDNINEYLSDDCPELEDVDKDILTAINAAATKYSEDPALIAAIVKQESGFQPDQTSSAGARGYMQIIPSTWTQIDIETAGDATDGDKNGTKDPYGVWDGIFAGTYYFTNSIPNELGNLTTLENKIAAYNAGPGAVQDYNGIPPYTETQDYVKNVLYYYELYKDCLSYPTSQIATAQWCWPTDPVITTITSHYGEDRGDHYHSGIDIAPEINESGHAVASRNGKIIRVIDSCAKNDNSCGGYGNYVLIEHQLSDNTIYTSLYAHLEPGILVETEDTVSQGQKLGIIDNSGNSNGPHLHFEIRRNNIATDPEPIIKVCSPGSFTSCLDSGQKAVQFAYSKLGNDYESGGVGGIEQNSFDCAGLFGSAWSWGLNNTCVPPTVQPYDTQFCHSGVHLFGPLGYNQLTYFNLPSGNEAAHFNLLQPGDALMRGTVTGTITGSGGDDNVSSNHDYQHMAMYAGPLSYNGIFFEHAVIQAGGGTRAGLTRYPAGSYNINISEYRDQDWADEFGRPTVCLE